MQLDSWLGQLSADVALFVRAAQWSGLDAAVPPCPGWDVRGLVRHQAMVHQRGRARLADRRPPPYESPPDDELVESFEAGAAVLVQELARSPQGLSVPTAWPAASPRDFWARRMAHETAIHRVDAELAAAFGVTDFPADFAADGLAELLEGMGPRYYALDALDRRFSVTFTPLDVNRGWTVFAEPGVLYTVAESRDDSDLSVFGPAAELYRWAWNRAADDEVSLRGDVTVADTWRDRLGVVD